MRLGSSPVRQYLEIPLSIIEITESSMEISMYAPSPLFSLPYSARTVARAPYIPDTRSPMEIPHFRGSPPLSPVTLIKPDMAWITRSRAPLERMGPVCPKPEMAVYTSLGLISFNTS